MPDGSDPGRAERYAEREVERIRRHVPGPNRTDIIHTIRKGRRGNIPSPKPRQDTKWLRENYPDIESRHREEHPASLKVRTSVDDSS